MYCIWSFVSAVSIFKTKMPYEGRFPAIFWMNFRKTSEHNIVFQNEGRGSEAVWKFLCVMDSKSAALKRGIYHFDVDIFFLYHGFWKRGSQKENIRFWCWYFFVLWILKARLLRLLSQKGKIWFWCWYLVFCVLGSKSAALKRGINGAVHHLHLTELSSVGGKICKANHLLNTQQVYLVFGEAYLHP